MSFRACLFAAQLREEASRPLLEARAARLPRFYRSVPWGDRLELRLTYVAGARALVGELRFDERPATRDTSLLTWGGPLPDGLGTAVPSSTHGTASYGASKASLPLSQWATARSWSSAAPAA